jgi:hypothetical protein
VDLAYGHQRLKSSLFLWPVKALIGHGRHTRQTFGLRVLTRFQLDKGLFRFTAFAALARAVEAFSTKASRTRYAPNMIGGDLEVFQKSVPVAPRASSRGKPQGRKSHLPRRSVATMSPSGERIRAGTWLATTMAPANGPSGLDGYGGLAFGFFR